LVNIHKKDALAQTPQPIEDGIKAAESSQQYFW